MRFVKRLIVWLVLSVPPGAFAGWLVAWRQTDVGDFRRSGFILGSMLAGLWVGVLGAVMAATTTTIARDWLRRAGASECLTGAVVSYGTVAAGLFLFRQY